MDSDDVDLIARIYDSALDPGIWPDLMLRIAHKLGARGSFIFELRLDNSNPQIASRIFSSNYIPEIVRDYMIRFNDDEIRDQGRFAELSQQGDPVDLISDIELRTSVAELMAQPNTAFMMKHGIKHRAGALLNKDLVNVDRFALQYPVEHGPITTAERKKAAMFLPHIAKVISLSRPLESQLISKGIFEDVLQNIEQGIAVLSPRGSILYANTEFERCIADHSILRISTNGTLQLAQQGATEKQIKQYHDLSADSQSLNSHGQFGARARKEAIVVELAAPGTALFIEICPVKTSVRTGNLGQGCRLVTIIDTSRKVSFDSSRLKSFYQLSPIETETLELIAKGHTNGEISEMRNRSPDTVKSQIKALMRKTNSQSRTDLVHMIHHLSSVVSYQAEQ